MLAHKRISTRPTLAIDMEYTPYTSLDFYKTEQKVNDLADIIEDRLEDLTDILLKYESYEVVQDEISRTLDLLRNLKENKNYFRLRVGSATAFLPRNQPLYAFTCFVLVPSLMTSEVHFRIPHSMHHFFSEMLALLNISELFPNVIVSSKTRIEFLTDRSALYIDPITEDTKPLTDVVIFTGTPVHADQLRLVFDKRTLFISNGAGHNPVIVSKDADLSKAVEAVLTLQFYNQGQDCAAPNSILVDKDILPNFLQMLRSMVSKVRVGNYSDKSCQIGPINDPEDLVRIQNLLIEHRDWLDSSTPGIIRSREAIIEPTIICKPLIEGGNFHEIFAPIIFIQEYKTDAELKDYFEDRRYAQNAMYITLYGTSKYIEKLINKRIRGRILHKETSLIRNTHLHAPGIERGIQPYGGYGYGASSISIDGKITPMPTLPQRDIYEWIAKPLIEKKKHIAGIEQFTNIQKKNVEKLLRLKPLMSDKQAPLSKISNIGYLDSGLIKTTESRYIKIENDYISYLLKEKNVEYIVKLEPKELKLILSLRTLLHRKSKISFDDFCTFLYAIPKQSTETNIQNAANQRHFFHHIYQLLLGKNSGPRLGPFLWDVNMEEIDKLLDV
jgi:acyl-CoA reductase-like NAD-dependent aldehyde dehydrogenase